MRINTNNYNNNYKNIDFDHYGLKIKMHGEWELNHTH